MTSFALFLWSQWNSNGLFSLSTMLPTESSVGAPFFSRKVQFVSKASTYSLMQYRTSLGPFAICIFIGRFRRRTCFRMLSLILAGSMRCVEAPESTIRSSRGPPCSSNQLSNLSDDTILILTPSLVDTWPPSLSEEASSEESTPELRLYCSQRF